MKRIILLASFCMLLSACSIYYEGTMSDHYDGTRFFDPEKTTNRGLRAFLKWQFSRNSAYWPESIELTETNVPETTITGKKLRVTNVGHATFLIQTAGLNILTDPVWSNRAGPYGLLGPKRVITPGIKFEDLPKIDVVLVSHNHYDHMDLPTLQKLWHKHKPRIIVPLGNDKIIKSQDQDIVVEAYDWWQVVTINDDIKIHLDPAQHWSARGIFDHNKALWASFVIETSGGNIYFVGDSGYGEGRYFKAAKERFGSFRLALLPIGAFEPRWFMEYAHMNPEEMVKAHLDLATSYSLPTHHKVFKLADDAYDSAEQQLVKMKKLYEVEEQVKVLDIGKSWDVPEL